MQAAGRTAYSSAFDYFRQGIGAGSKYLRITRPRWDFGSNLGDQKNGFRKMVKKSHAIPTFNPYSTFLVTGIQTQHHIATQPSNSTSIAVPSYSNSVVNDVDKTSSLPHQLPTVHIESQLSNA